MWFIFIFLLAGVFVGFLFRDKNHVLASAQKATTWAVYLLIFFLGVSVGFNKTVMAALGTLGEQALALSVGSITGSVLI